MMTRPKDFDDYADSFPSTVGELLRQLRATVQAAAPQATEGISYGMPAFKLHGALVYFGAYEHHIGFYPTPSGIAAFKDELTDYKCAKGTVQFPLDKPLPLDLIARIVTFRVAENLMKKNK